MYRTIRHHRARSDRGPAWSSASRLAQLALAAVLLALSPNRAFAVNSTPDDVRESVHVGSASSVNSGSAAGEASKEAARRTCLQDNSASVSPCGGTVSVPQSVTRSVSFSVTNTNTMNELYNFACSFTGEVTSCSTVDTSVAVGASASTSVSVSFGVSGILSTGTVRLVVTKARGGFDEDPENPPKSDGFYTVTVGDSLHRVPQFVNSPSSGSVLATADGSLRSMGLCAMGCFEATASYTTPAHITMDAPRAATLAYNARTVRPWAVVQVDVADYSPVVPAKISLKLQDPAAGNAAVAFEGGSTELFFVGANGKSRLTGRIAMTGRAAGAHDFTAVVTSHWTDGTPSKQVTGPIRILVLDDSASPYGAGWSVAGVPRLVTDSAKAKVMLLDGAGSAALFTGSTSQYVTPAGEFGTLAYVGGAAVDHSYNGHAGIYDPAPDTLPRIFWERRYPDSTKIAFDSLGRAIYVRDRLWNQTTFRWLDAVRLTAIRDPEERTLAFTYDANGMLSGIHGPGGRKTLFTIDGSGDLRQVRDSATGRHLASFSYASGHQLANRRDADSASWSFAYDRVGFLAADTLPAIDTTGANLSAAVNPVVRYRSLEAALVIDPASGIGTSGSPAPRVNPDTLFATVTDPEGNVTKLALNRWGQPLWIKDPVGAQTTFGYTSAAQLSGVALPSGGTTQATWDAQGRLTGQRGTTGDWTYYRYGAYSQVDSVWGDGRAPTRYFIGTRGRVDSVKVGADSSAYTTRYSYFPSRNRIWQVTDPKGHVTEYGYHAATGNVDTVAAPGGRFAAFDFDGFGRVITSRAKQRSAVQVEYDQFNRPTKSWTVGLSPADTVRFYYASAFLDSIVDGKGQRYRWTRNALGMIEQEHDPKAGNGSMKYAYDLAGRVKRWTNRRGQTMHYAYDAAGRVTHKYETGSSGDHFSHSPDGRTVLGWNDISKDEVHYNQNMLPDSVVTRFMTDTTKRFRLKYTWDGRGRLTSVTPLSNSGVYFASRGFRWAGPTNQLDTILINGIAHLRYSYNEEGMLDTTSYPVISDKRWVGYTTRHRPYVTNHSISALSSALYRGYGLDTLDRYNEVIAKDGSGYLVTEYSYDGKGRLFGWGTSNRSTLNLLASFDEDYGYDVGAAALSGITYDGADNLVADSASSGNAVNFAYDTANRVQSRVSSSSGSCGMFHCTPYNFSYQHDADGNRTLRAPLGSSTGTTYTWNAESRLTSVAGVTFEYNAFGVYVRRRTNGNIDRHLLWDRGNLFAELDSGLTSRRAEYVHEFGLDRPIALLTGATTITKTRYFEQDQLGNVIGVFDGAGAQKLDYAYGGSLNVNAGLLGDTSRMAWKGAMREPGVGLYYLRNRWYDPETYRFMSEDPIGLEGGVNMYSFANEDPINLSDPMGLSPHVSVIDPTCTWGMKPGGGCADPPPAYTLEPIIVYAPPSSPSRDPFGRSTYTDAHEIDAFKSGIEEALQRHFTETTSTGTSNSRAASTTQTSRTKCVARRTAQRIQDMDPSERAVFAVVSVSSAAFGYVRAAAGGATALQAASIGARRGALFGTGDLFVVTAEEIHRCITSSGGGGSNW